jgi:hypothetical protein
VCDDSVVRELHDVISRFLARNEAIGHGLPELVAETLTSAFRGADVVAVATWTEPEKKETTGLVGCVSGRWVLATAEPRRGDDAGPYEAETATTHLAGLEGVSVRVRELHRAHSGDPDSVVVAGIDLLHAAFPSGLVRINLTQESEDDCAEIRDALLKSSRIV